MPCITVRIVTHPARAYAVSVAAAALRAAGLDGVFLIREAEPGVLELTHNARRESTLHLKTDLFEACRALERASFEPFEVGCLIIARKVAVTAPRPPLAKASSGGDPSGESEGGGESQADGEADSRDGKTRVA